MEEPIIASEMEVDAAWMSSAKSCGEQFRNHFTSKLQQRKKIFTYLSIYILEYSDHGSSMEFVCPASEWDVIDNRFVVVVNDLGNVKAFRLTATDNDNEIDLTECSHNFAIETDDFGWLKGHAKGATVGVLSIDKPLPVICGGGTDNADKCFGLTDNFGIDSNASMNSARIGAASLVVDNGKSLWVTGGYNSESPALSTTELVTANLTSDIVVSSHVSHRLPTELKHHCLVGIGPEHALMIGGQDKNDINKGESWLYHLPSSVFAIMKHPLGTARSNHACGVLKLYRNATEEVAHVVIAAGGLIKQGLPTASVEMLVLLTVGNGEDVNTMTAAPWNPGPSMPKSAPGLGIANADNNKLIVVTGSLDNGIDNDNLVFVFQCNVDSPMMSANATTTTSSESWLQCQWTILDNKELTRPSLLAFVLPPTEPMMASFGALEVGERCDPFNPKRGKKLCCCRANIAYSFVSCHTQVKAC